MSMAVRALMLVGLIVFISDTQCECATWKYSCPTGWSYYSGSCYTLIKEKQTWAAAQGACETLGANLVIISDSKENKHVHQLVTQASIVESDLQLWIGLHDQVVEGHYTWIKSNRVARWSNWAKDQPDDWHRNEDCGTILPDGTWNDNSCSEHRRFICEFYL